MRHEGDENHTGEVLASAVPAALGLGAFAASSVVGLMAGNTGVSILTRALIAMTLCYALGHLLAWAAGVAAHEHTSEKRAEDPIPEVPEVAVPVGPPPGEPGVVA